MLRHLSLAALVFCAMTAPAVARDDDRSSAGGHGGWSGGWQGGYVPGPVYYPPMFGPPYPTVVMAHPVDGPPPPVAYPQGYASPDPRWGEMIERCRKVQGDSGVGGALLGGVAGGVVGNRVVDGNRTLGTVAGAAVGAIAGAAIDKAEDSDLRRECDDYFRSMPRQAYGYPGGGYAPYGYMMVPVMLPPQKPCVETTVVTEKWVDEPVRSRYIPRRAPAVKEKRVKEKRVYTG
ncbi:17 kDa surface antigen [Novosphingobium aromaticivorans DSM 12444]|uniref:17 kDa surface antigen n=1 Tax=Novosphingobium aromaticivorans (strain ATCC 700278 / DSM 12444 / CCUG 56034 / CIP 105152 / NBRC 16084 / F199) TaxID=279238 RepID=Q2GC43_NOVAD|nr:glycine zipper 2TM domain-containing protein [Novosphingobium aromaticivorans]ABD24580.1 17 kDa surface antigen [Novosphingobium aromaticivorans DSM 12444]SCY23923.1 Glycine zipper 2TM domain-containing protein [Novosphingobium aromaticivorans]